MSFSFSAAGTRDETLASLADETKTGRLSEDGGKVRDLIAGFIGDGLDEWNGKTLRYEVSANGHHAANSTPSLNIRLTCG